MSAPDELEPDVPPFEGEALGEEPPLVEEAPPLVPELVPELPADGEPLVEGELAPGVPAADGLEEPDVPIVVEFFELLELLPLVDGVVEDEPEVPLVDGLVADGRAGAGELPLEEEPLLPLLSQAARASTPSAALVIKKSFRMYSPPEPKVALVIGFGSRSNILYKLNNALPSEIIPKSSPVALSIASTRYRAYWGKSHPSTGSIL